MTWVSVAWIFKRGSVAVARCMAPSGSVTTYLGNATLDVAASGGVESGIALDAGHHPGGLGQGLVDGALRPEHRRSTG